jgi:hypothetical protein
MLEGAAPAFAQGFGPAGRQRHSKVFDHAMVPVCGLPRTRSGRQSEALNVAGSLLTENRAHLRALV